MLKYINKFKKILLKFYQNSNNMSNINNNCNNIESYQNINICCTIYNKYEDIFSKKK